MTIRPASRPSTPTRIFALPESASPARALAARSAPRVASRFEPRGRADGDATAVDAPLDALSETFAHVLGMLRSAPCSCAAWTSASPSEWAESWSREAASRSSSSPDSDLERDEPVDRRRAERERPGLVEEHGSGLAERLDRARPLTITPALRPGRPPTGARSARRGSAGRGSRRRGRRAPAPGRPTAPGDPGDGSVTGRKKIA